MAQHHGRKGSKPTDSATDKTITQEEEEEEDPYDLRIKNSGCADSHYALQDCFIETGDWRKCQKQMKDFKDCMASQRQKHGNS